MEDRIANIKATLDLADWRKAAGADFDAELAAAERRARQGAVSRQQAATEDADDDEDAQCR